MSFSDLRKKSKDSLASVSAKFEQEKSGGYQKDKRFWSLTVDKAGTGQAVIRFCPPVPGEEVPYVKRFEHNGKLNNKFYINYSRTTLGRDEKDPMNEYFFEVRGDGTDKARAEKAKPFSRSTNYIANIYIVSDPGNPENNGKVFLYKFGSTIFQKLEAAIKPEFKDMKPFDPFNFWEGANFKLRAREKNGLRSYDLAEFEACGPLFDDDEEIEKVYNAQFPLLPEIAPEKFKSYEQLKKELDRFIGESPSIPTKDVEFDDIPDFPKDSPEPPKATRKSEVKKDLDPEAPIKPSNAKQNATGDSFAKYQAMLED